MPKPNRPFVAAILAVSFLAALALIKNPLRGNFRLAFAASRAVVANIVYPATHAATSRPLARMAPSVSIFPATLANLPLAFEPNRGQAPLDAAFLARGGNFHLYLRPSEALLTFPHLTRNPHAHRPVRVTQDPIHLGLAGA